MATKWKDHYSLTNNDNLKELQFLFFLFFILAGGYKQERFKDGTLWDYSCFFFLLCCLGKINTADMNEAEPFSASSEQPVTAYSAAARHPLDQVYLTLAYVAKGAL